jgi:ABC-type dipeptide/oligopeptide/nickel transport system permease subunit
LVVLAVVAPMLWGDAARTPNVPDMLQGSSSEHLLGTDNLGRDMLARTLVATRLSLVLALLAVLVAAGIGIPWCAAHRARAARRPGGGRADRVLAGLPRLVLALFLAVVLGVGPHAAVLAVGIAGAPTFARLTQTLSASVARFDYVAAAQVLGLSRWRILSRHVVPNIAEPIILNITIAIGQACSRCPGLSFLGLGVQPPSADWGRLLDEALDRIYVTPEAALGPCLAIVLTGVAFNGLGEALAQAASTRPARIRRTAAAAGHERGTADESSDDVLRVDGLTVSFPSGAGEITPVRGISFSVRSGETLGIVGESASGKSLTALSLSGLVAYPGQVSAQRLEFLGKDLLTMSAGGRRRLLGTSLAMVFQDPSTSLNPALRIGTQMARWPRSMRGFAGRLRSSWPSTGCGRCACRVRSGG